MLYIKITQMDTPNCLFDTKSLINDIERIINIEMHKAISINISRYNLLAIEHTKIHFNELSSQFYQTY